MPKKLLLITFPIITILIILSFRVFEFLNPLFPHTNYLLGKNSPTTYLFLLGNDTEARANGGFFGSYAKITLSSPRFYFLSFRVFEFFHEMKSEISFHDIYVPDGQLDGYVKPPDAIQQAFSHGTWQLSNADFDPNFPTTATTIRWFLEKGKETNPHILGILNLSTIKKILNILGPIKITDKNVTLTPDNLYLFLQGQAELNFFPGSTQKADALHSVGSATFQKLKSLSLFKKYQIAKIIYTELKNQNLVLNSTNPDFQKLLEDQNFAGIYSPKSLDHYGLVELNLGANKANAYVTRHTTHTISTNSPVGARHDSPETSAIIHKVNIQFQNTSPEANPNPPLHYGGNYLAFIRLYLPKNATNIEINHTEIATDSSTINPEILKNQNPTINPPSTIYDLQSISFWHITLAGNQSQINLTYTLPIDDSRHCEPPLARVAIRPLSDIPCNYSLTILKQNGFPTSPQTINLFGQNFTTPLTSTFTFAP